MNSESILRFENVSLAFDDVVALDRVSFDLHVGDTLIVLGAAGSGKSVMLKVALGLLKPDSGRVCLFNTDITRMEEHDLYQLRSRVGVLFQEGGLFDSLTIEENVSYPLLNQQSRQSLQNGAISERVRESLRFVELEHVLQRFPNELSGGMRRRVGIARANVTQPELVLYDSPTAGLDPITANTIITLIVKARDTRNSTSVLVTHRYQDGHLLANFRYNPQSSRIETVPPDDHTFRDRTTFMVFGDGKLVFEGTQGELEQSADPYISKFKWVKA
jgi:phospholipid/cholesterol/gamma-HCH transport system ATP-binding protein